MLPCRVAVVAVAAVVLAAVPNILVVLCFLGKVVLVPNASLEFTIVRTVARTVGPIAVNDLKQTTSALHPAHLPGLFPDPAAYARAYEYIRLVDGVFHGDAEDWHEARLPVGLSAVEVYRRLPTAPGFEFAGYLTRTRIRYVEG